VPSISGSADDNASVTVGSISGSGDLAVDTDHGVAIGVDGSLPGGSVSNDSSLADDGSFMNGDSLTMDGDSADLSDGGQL
jgi:hypothetical protein